MRHRKLRRKLGIRTDHRKALLRNLVRALVQKKRIRTTYARAKEASAFADRLITIGKRGGLHARRLLISKTADAEVARCLAKEIVPLYEIRKGGYTRVLRLPPRPGDGADMAILEFTADFPVAEKKKKPAKDKKPSKAQKVQAEEEAASEKKEKGKKPQEKESKTKTEEAGKKEQIQDASKSESEKKGGFLSTLRKFLKGSDH